MPAVGQGEGKLCPRTATACDPALRSGHFRLKVSLLSGNHKRNITLASKMSCSTANFAKGSIMSGGEGGIRTRVGATNPLTAFEAAPL